MINAIGQKMEECERCIICNEHIGAGNNPAVCSTACFLAYRAECSHNKMAKKETRDHMFERVVKLRGQIDGRVKWK